MDLATTHDKQLIRRHSNKHTANSKRVCVRFTTNVVALSFAFEIFFFFYQSLHTQSRKRCALPTTEHYFPVLLEILTPIGCVQGENIQH